jgi:hypothetical protein
MIARPVLARSPATSRRASGQPSTDFFSRTSSLGRRDGFSRRSASSSSREALSSPASLAKRRGDRRGRAGKMEKAGGGGGPPEAASKKKLGKKLGTQVERREKKKSPPPEPAPWDERFEQLRAYRLARGHAKVKARENAELARWVGDQRYWYARGELPPERREKLESLGFASLVGAGYVRAPWDVRFEQLRAYHEARGHSHVRYGDDPWLADWADDQRTWYAHGSLPRDQFRALRSIDFDFHLGGSSRPGSVSEWDWEYFFLRLRAYRAAHGHAHVSTKEDAKLAKWTIRQRTKYWRNALTPARRDALESIGFELESAEGVCWKVAFSRLEEHRAERGHVRVSPRGDLKLAAWVRLQRRAHARDELSRERRAKLESVGFDFEGEYVCAPFDARFDGLGYEVEGGYVWVPWEERREYLEAFHANHAECARVSTRREGAKLEWTSRHGLPRRGDRRRWWPARWRREPRAPREYEFSYR